MQCVFVHHMFANLFEATGVNTEIANSLELVVTTLLELLEKNGKAWAPVICAWSVEALGMLLQKHG